MLAASDSKLVSAALAGKARAWDKLVKRYDGLVYNYALRMVSNPDDARDIMQDTFMAVCRNLAGWRGESQFKSWLMTIAHHRCVEFYRRRREQQGLDDSEEPRSDCDWHQPEQVYSQQQQGRRLVAALQQIPLAQRQVLEMKFFQQLTLTDIAQRTGTSLNTVKSRLYSGADKLKQLLEGES
ncbi:RNA polymerase sigma factor [Idiomarina xiamenensis]|uniref:ECF subfamily RNA polymerase sigma-24 subunit n=1 Tax=Idiomarina xiamenensis 10-D-4 TaxID=740709 RepID=K2KLP8_9GAMM|nr:sigma-70 family RNA polymerase sigma factor [Idiomarina xiamenensis]EKE87507.1 ECF subfamily RNA polymerase sigma-24 subunit [Idiomarina xiamenensis 10-D-4]